MAASVFGGGGHSSVLPPSLGPISLGRMLEIYLPTVAKGVTPLWAAMFVVGALSVRGTWRRADRVALALVAATLFAAIWIHLWAGHFSCKRYVFPAVLMGSGSPAWDGSAFRRGRPRGCNGSARAALSAWAPAALCGGAALALAFGLQFQQPNGDGRPGTLDSPGGESGADVARAERLHAGGQLLRRTDAATPSFPRPATTRSLN